MVLRLWTTQLPTSLPASCLYRIADGAVVGRVPLGQHGQVRLEILSDASELPLDLTGLALIESSEAKANLSRVLAEAANTLDRAMPECVRMAPNAASGLKSLLGQLQTAR